MVLLPRQWSHRLAYRERPDLHLADGGTIGTFTALSGTGTTTLAN